MVLLSQLYDSIELFIDIWLITAVKDWGKMRNKREKYVFKYYSMRKYDRNAGIRSYMSKFHFEENSDLEFHYLLNESRLFNMNKFLPQIKPT